MSIKPVELVVIDFDGTLYNSPKPLVEYPGWWHSAKSLEGFGEPGWDAKWHLPVLIEARRALQSPWTRVVLVTARPQHAEMRAVITSMLSAADLRFHGIQLKPPFSAMSTPQFKAAIVQKLLLSEPTITKVTMFDDQQENLEATERVSKRLNRQFVPMHITIP